MANLDDDKVLDVILGEAASVAKYGQQASYEDMLAIASSIANRAQRYNATPVEVARDKTQYHAQKPAPGMEAYRDLARQAVQQVMTQGAVHNGTYYHKSNTVPSSFEFATRTAAHTFYDDPQNRPIQTTAGVKRAASPQATRASFSPAVIPTPTPAPRGAPATPARGNIDPIDINTGYERNYGPRRPADPKQNVMDFTRAAVGSYFGPGYSVRGISGRGNYGGIEHRGGNALDFDVLAPDGSKVTDKDRMYGFAAHMAQMNPNVSIGYDQRNPLTGGYMGAGRLHVGLMDRAKQWGPRGTIANMDPTLSDMITAARERGRNRDLSVVPTPRPQSIPTLAQRPQIAIQPNSNIIAPVRTSTTLAPVNTSVASRVPAGATIAPVQQQPLSPTRSPAATRSVETSTVAPAVTAQPVSVRSSTPSARSAQEASMAALNAITAQPLGRVPSPTPNPRGAYANRPADTPAMERAMAEATRGARVYDGTTAPSNPVMGSTFRGFGAGGPLGNLLTGNGQFGVGGNMRGTIAGGVLGGLLAGPMGIAAGAAIGSRLGNDGSLLGGMFSGNSGQDNSGSFTVANPSGGRGLMDMSGGPVSMGSITATPTPSSGGYRSTDSATGWSSYSNPQTGITTTFDAQGNTLGGPGMAPSVGGDSPGGKG